ncbi:MAG: TIGR03617 family F420-dependent LLM class oxidoreductase [Actinomycetota bacterium]
MRIDGGIIGDGSRAGALEEAGYDGGWIAEMNNDPFLPLVTAAERTSSLELGTGIAVAFARNPMTLAQTAYDLQKRSEGRFLLGLGSQIKPHITKRFSMPWSKPAARMKEMIAAIRAIWDCWDGDGTLDFRGEFYQHTPMTPMFNPGPNPFGQPWVILGPTAARKTLGWPNGLGPGLNIGIICHGFTTADYVRDTTRPELEVGLAASGRSLDDFELSIPAMIVTGTTEEEMAGSDRAVRKQLAFYGSTPAYRPVLEHHGYGDLQDELNRLSKQGEWDAMGERIDEDLLHLFAVVAEPADLAAAVRARWDGLVTRLNFYAPYEQDPDTWLPIVEELKGA